MANNIIKRTWNQNRMVNIEALQGMAFQAEDGGHTFEISGVDDSGNPVALSGTVAGVFVRPDNADIALSGTASDGKVYVTLSDACYAVPGKFGLTIFVTADSKKTAVYAAIGTVTRTSGGVVAGATPQDVVDLINAIEAAVATIPASYTNLMDDIAPTYSNTALYAVGAYAWYNGTLYRCTTPITTAETWTAAHWTAAVLGDDVGDVKSAIQYVADTGFMVNDIVWQRGGVDASDGSITSQAYRATNTEPFTITKDTKITLTNSLYRYGVCQIGSGTWSGWLTSGGLYNLETGKAYRFQIAKVTEDYIRLTDEELASMGDSLSLSTSVYDLLAESDNTERMAEYGSSAFNESAFIIGVHYGSGSYYKDTARITNENPISFPYETRINVENGYRFAMIELDSEGTVVSTTSWITTSYFVKANTNYYINIDNGNTSATAVVSLYISKLSYRTEIGYAIDRLNGVSTYSYDGIDIAPQTHGFNTRQMPWNFSGPTTSGSYTPQAMGYYNGVVFKCWKDNLIQLYNFETGAKIAEYPATIGHGDCMDFSNEFYTSDDEFPLAYFSPDAETTTVYVNRLTRTGATLIRTLVFDVETVGYYTGCAVDGENNRLIILGYTKQAHATDDGTNFMVCTVWNLNNLTNNGDTYTPELMKNFTLPFMATTQDQCYTDNKFYVISSKAEQYANTVIYVVDIGDESVVAKITDMPYKNWETEGIFWKGNKMYINGSGITEYSFVN